MLLRTNKNERVNRSGFYYYYMNRRLEKRSKSVPLFWIADIRCVFVKKTKNEVVL